MEFFIKISQFLLSLSLLIVLHELGHFIPAKLFKTRVEKFYLFFDVKFSLLKKKVGETVYGIGWLPLGGYVKIAGMIDESMDKEQMQKDSQPWEFRSKPSWQRLIIMLGGVTVNFILALFIYILILFVWGNSYVKKDDIKYGYAISKTLEKYGFQQGDKIISVDGNTLEDLHLKLHSGLNKYFMLRGVNKVIVEHPDHTKSSIQLGSDMGRELFESGGFPAFVPRVPVKIDSVVSGTPAAFAGFKPGDKLISIDGESVFEHNLLNLVNSYNNVPLQFVIDRGGMSKIISAVPEKAFNNNSNLKDSSYQLGISYSPSDLEYFKLQKKNYNFKESFTEGLKKGYYEINDYLAQFKYIFSKKGASQLGGFGTIYSLFPAKWNWQAFWTLTAFLSIMLGVLNLLPIPALDGGHVMFLLYEMVSGRKPSDKFMEYAQTVGFFILIALVLFANGNDIYRAIFS